MIWNFKGISKVQCTDKYQEGHILILQSTEKI